VLKAGPPAAKKIALLKEKLRKQEVPAIYVNDNFGRWQSDFRTHVTKCLQASSPGSAVDRPLIPGENDYSVLKPKHSGFFSTSLDVLLSYLGAKKLIVTGFAADICVHFTANDAYMRDFELAIPRIASRLSGKGPNRGRSGR
jgi:nicotinamidase-related amidase